MVSQFQLIIIALYCIGLKIERASIPLIEGIRRQLVLPYTAALYKFGRMTSEFRYSWLWSGSGVKVFDIYRSASNIGSVE